MNPQLGAWAALCALLALGRLAFVAAISVDPCGPLDPVKRGGDAFVVGIALWPGGTGDDWGPPESGLNPCNATDRANLTAAGAHFASYAVRVDRLSVLKTTFPEQLALTSSAAPGTPLVMSAVAFRAGVRSEARYVVSAEPKMTGGTGFVSTLSLMSRFERGALRYLQFYNLTCNDCGGWRGARCLNGTSCTLPVGNCTCPVAASVPSTGNGSVSGSSNSSSGNAASPSPSPAAGGGRQLAQDVVSPGAAAPNAGAGALAPNAAAPALNAAVPAPNAALAAPNAAVPAPEMPAVVPDATAPAFDAAALAPGAAAAGVLGPDAAAPNAGAPAAAAAGASPRNAPAQNAGATNAAAANAGGRNAPASNAAAPNAAAPNAAAPNAVVRNTTIASTSASPSPGACNYTQFAYCAASINLAFDGLDANGASFQTATQVRKLNSYSLVALFAKGKALFFDFKDKYDNSMTDYWGKFQVAQQELADAYSGNPEAGRTTGTV